MEEPNTKAELNEQIHAGRRKKLRDRFIESGLEHFNECEVLEFALGYCIPRQDTNPAAHALIQQFATLPTVVDANPADLAKVFGVGERASIFLHFLKEFSSYLAKERIIKNRIVTPGDAERILGPLLRSYSVERYVVLCLDCAGNVIKIHTFTNNELQQVHVNIREILSIVTSVKTAQVILAHNHLNGISEPSVSDMNLTRRLIMILDCLDIKLVDHVIIAEKEHYSFHCSGMLQLLKVGLD